MARVPTYEGPQVREQALRPVQQREIDVSSGLRVASQVAGQASQVFDRIQERADSAAAFDAEVRLRSDWMEADAELRKRHTGVNAKGYRDSVEKWWGEAPIKYGADLSPQAKLLANRSMAQAALQARSGAIQYETGEVTRAQHDAFAEAKRSAIQGGLTTGTPDAVAGARRRVIEANSEQAARDGWDPKKLEMENLRDLSLLHASYTTKLLDVPGGNLLAKQYLAANRGEISDAVRAGLEDRVEKVGRISFAQDEADKVKAQFSDLAQAMDHVQKTYSGDDEKAIKAEVMSRFQVDEAARNDRERKAYGSARMEYEQTGRVRPSTLSLLNDGQRADLMRTMKADQKARAAEARGHSVKTDFAVWYDVSNRIAAGEKVDLRAYADKVSENDLQALTAKQQTRATPGKQDALYTTMQRVEKTFPGLGIDPKKDPESAYRVTNEVDRRIRVLSTAKGGKPLMPDEEQRIVDDVVLDKVYVEEFGRDPSKPVALLTPDELSKAYVNVNGREVKVSSVPSSFREKSLAARKRAGLPATEQGVVEDYLAREAEKNGQRKTGTVTK